jgi:hypothetical protein
MFLQILIIVLAFSFFGDETKSNQFGSVVLSAAILYGDEDEVREPIQGSFYLLDESLIESLRKAKFEPIDENGKLLKSDEAFLSAAAHALLQLSDEAGITHQSVADLIAKHSKAEIITFSNGFRRVKSIKTGKYYLFGAHFRGDEIIIWHFPVLIKPGENKIELDQYNAEVL